MKRLTQSIPMLAIVVFSACRDPSTAPAASGESSRPLADAAAAATAIRCPASPTYTVSNEAGLRAALAAARPGAVIAIRGMIGLSSNVLITTPKVTLSCATRGSGLYALSTAVDVLVVVDVGGDGVIVDGLALDARGTNPLAPGNLIGGPFFVGDFNGPGETVSNVVFSNNVVSCGPGNCAAFVGASGARILNNTFNQSFATYTGIHIQTGIDSIRNVRVQGNIINTTAQGTVDNFGGIRVAVATNVVVADNVITGPWVNSISIMSISHSLVTGNRVTGAAFDGIRLGNRGAAPNNAVNGNLILGNRATASGEAGLAVNMSCGNLFVGNQLHGNAGGVGAIFSIHSGANSFIGDGTIVIDDGQFDCNGDGTIDPNLIIGGFRRSSLGGQLGATISSMSSDSPSSAAGSRLK